MSSTFSFELLLKLANDRDAAALLNDIVFEPTTGVGSPISPVTYAASAPRGRQHEAGPAFTDYTVIRTAGPDGFHQVVVSDDGPTIGSSVIIDSIGSQARRDQNALWAQRDILNLPGICLDAASEESQKLVEQVFMEQLKAIKGADKAALENRAMAYLPNFLETYKNGDPSSWTFPHGHADAWLRTAIDPQTGKPVWAGGDLYEKIISAGPTNVTPLMLLSPNSLLYGFWLSIGTPIAHKQARSISSEIIGYRAKRMWRSATKGSPYQTSNRSQITVDQATGTINLKDGLAAKPVDKQSPSNAGFGMIPTSWTDKAVACVDVLGTSTVSFAGLRSAVAQDSSLDQEKRDAIVAALVALGIYGRALTATDGFLRSGCDLLEVSNTWGIRRRGNSGAQKIEIPKSTSDLLPVVNETLDHARNLGVFGSAEDRIYLTPSREGIALTAQALFAQSLAKGDTDSND